MTSPITTTTTTTNTITTNTNTTTNATTTMCYVLNIISVLNFFLESGLLTVLF